MKLGVVQEKFLEHELEFTPVDWAAQAIYKLIINPSEQNRIFHLYNHNIIPIEEYLEIANSLDDKIQVVSEETFKQRILNLLNDGEIDLQNLISVLDDEYHLYYHSEINLNSNFTVKYLDRCKFNWPIISKEYLIDFIKLIRKEK